MFRVIALLSMFHFIRAGYVISVYGDVMKDKEFFTDTFPWIIDNIGGEIVVEFHLLGSGRYSVPQMCALKELKMNTFLQAQYLKCEAEGRLSKYCLCETGIDPVEFKQCVRREGDLASNAAAEFMRLNVGISPLIELGNGSGSTVFGVPDIWYLKKICTIFGEFQPMGCVKSCNKTETGVAKEAIAHFDKDCGLSNIPESCE
ncbi:unnamed protein product [Diatraea saccharalis]|uniref:Uncharacterized protein n=1 Tax=Diatraea saccharalis TaxID=40085 RepID=A0A9N9N154_9NEOP|nr:unnamed protein product [Diatraea saccharalis]